MNKDTLKAVAAISGICGAAVAVLVGFYWVADQLDVHPAFVVIPGTAGLGILCYVLAGRVKTD